MSMMAIVLVAFGVVGVFSFIKENRRIWVLSILSSYLFANTLWAVQKNKLSVSEAQQNLADAISWIKTLNNNEKILFSNAVRVVKRGERWDCRRTD